MSYCVKLKNQGIISGMFETIDQAEDFAEQLLETLQKGKTSDIILIVETETKTESIFGGYNNSKTI